MLIFDKFNKLIGDFNVSLCKPDFRNASLQNAYLANRILRGANFRGADLRGAILLNADLRDADLCDADLRGANLYQVEVNDYTSFWNAKLPKFQIPQSKSLIVWKKLYDGVGSNNLICKLRIPQRAKRTASLVGKKCRAERAFVEEIIHLRSQINRDVGFSMFDRNFRYEVGKQVWVTNFDDDIRYECVPGIHFFMDRKDAERY